MGSSTGDALEVGANPSVNRSQIRASRRGITLAGVCIRLDTEVDWQPGDSHPLKITPAAPGVLRIWVRCHGFCVSFFKTTFSGQLVGISICALS